MNREVHRLNIQHLAFQRNAFILFSFASVIVSLFLAVILLTKKEKVIIVPHSLNETVWVEGNRVSESYLKQQAQVVSMLFLSKTPSSAKEQATMLLQMTTPSLYGSLKAKLVKEIAILNEQGASYVFIPKKTMADESTMSVEMTGERLTYIGGKLLSTEKERYVFCFKYNGLNLQLNDIRREELK